MKAALMREYHQPLELVERPVPEPAEPTDVLVRIGGAGVCATDLHAIEGLMEPAGVTLPRVLGHENAGWVEEIGAGVTTVAKGDAVLVYPPFSCGLCVACRRGNDMHCARHEFTGLSVDGGFAEYVLVSERSLLRLPDGVEPAEVAPHSDAGLTAYHAVRRLAALQSPGTTAVVIGVGGVGHIALQLLRELGSSATIAVDTDSRRRSLAAELGAGDVLDGDGSVDAVRELTGGRGADLVFDFVGTDQSHADSAAMLARGGTYSVIGYGGIDRDALGGARRQRARGRRQPRRDVGRPLGAAAAPRGRPGRPEDRGAPAGFRQRRPPEAPRRRGHRPRRAGVSSDIVGDLTRLGVGEAAALLARAPRVVVRARRSMPGPDP